MKVLPICFLLLLIYQNCLGQESPFSRTYIFADTRLNVAGTCYVNCNGSGSVINLFGVKDADIAIIKNYLNTDGGMHSSWKHLGKRLFFAIAGKRYSVDPNFIYTTAGTKASLLKGGRYTIAAAKEVQGFASQLSHDYIDGKRFVIAYNTDIDSSFSILNFRKGNTAASNAEKVFINPLMDANDFVMTSNESVFDHLLVKKINVVLQKKIILKDDGSLSVYAAKKKVPYISIEVNKTHIKEKTQIMEALKEVIGRL